MILQFNQVETQFTIRGITKHNIAFGYVVTKPAFEVQDSLLVLPATTDIWCTATNIDSPRVLLSHSRTFKQLLIAEELSKREPLRHIPQLPMDTKLEYSTLEEVLLKFSYQIWLVS